MHQWLRTLPVSRFFSKFQDSLAEMTGIYKLMNKNCLMPTVLSELRCFLRNSEAWGRPLISCPPHSYPTSDTWSLSTKASHSSQNLILMHNLTVTIAILQAVFSSAIFRVCCVHAIVSIRNFARQTWFAFSAFATWPGLNFVATRNQSALQILVVEGQRTRTYAGKAKTLAPIQSINQKRCN